MICLQKHMLSSPTHPPRSYNRISKSTNEVAFLLATMEALPFLRHAKPATCPSRCTCLFVYSSIYLFIYLSTCLVYLFICLSVYLFIYLSMYVYIYINVYIVLFIYEIFISIYRFIYLLFLVFYVYISLFLYVPI